LATRVLVVDDVSEMLGIIRRVLTSAGYDVAVAASLGEARAMEPAAYDCVLVDAQLGSESGSDLVEIVCAQDPAAMARCVLMTGGALDQLPPGPARLHKPFVASELLAVVRTASERAAAGAPRRDHDRPSTGAPSSAAPDTPDTTGTRPLPSAAASRSLLLLDVIRQRRSHDWRQLASFLHDGPIQDLAAALLELDPAVGATARMDDPLAASLRERIRSASDALRWLVDGGRPWIPAGSGLPEALERRLAWYLPGPAHVTVGESAGFRPDERMLIADVLELMVMEVIAEGQVQLPAIAVGADERRISIEVSGRVSQAADDAGAGAVRASLARLAALLPASVESEVADGRWLVRFGVRRWAA